MESLLPTNQNDFIPSRQVAKATGKRHDHVLRDIKVLIEKRAIDLIINQNPNLGTTNDEPICIEGQYVAGTGKSYPEYLLNEDAASVLATSYDPVIARKLIKLVKELRKATTKILSPAEQSLQQAQLILAQERRITKVEDSVKCLMAQNKNRPDYFTIAGYATLQGMHVGLKMASSLGKKATSFCKKNGYMTETLPDPRFGKVKTYPLVALEEVFENNPINA